MYSGTEENSHTPFLEQVLHVTGDLGIHDVEKTGVSIEDRHLRAQSVGYGREFHTYGTGAHDDDVFRSAAAKQDCVGVADSQDIERDMRRPKRSRTRRDQNCFRTQFTIGFTFARHDDATVAVQAGGALYVIYVVLRDVFSRDLLQQLADVPGALADDIGGDLWRCRHAKSVDIAVSKARDIQRSFPQRLRWCAAGGGDRAAGPVLLDNCRAMAEERGQFGRAFSGGARSDCNKVVRIDHGNSVISRLLHLVEHFRKRFLQLERFLDFVRRNKWILTIFEEARELVFANKLDERGSIRFPVLGKSFEVLEC